MGHKISKEQIDPGVKDHIMSFVGDKNELETSDKSDMVNAINSLIVDRVDNINNINKLANSIGNPVTASDNVDEVCDKVNGLLSTFKTNMMNNGVTVESGDKFKSLIDKIVTLVDSDGKGVQYATGNGSWSIESDIQPSVTIETNLTFTPTLIICLLADVKYMKKSSLQSNFSNVFLSSDNEFNHASTTTHPINIIDISQNSFTIKSNIIVSGSSYTGYTCTCTEWYAIGVGEENTDAITESLRNILINKGINLTGSETLSELILKVDELNNVDKNACVVLPSDAIEISKLSNNSLILKEDGTLWGSGANTNCELGLGDVNNRYYFNNITDNVDHVVSGSYHSFIIKKDGTIWGFGDNGRGELGSKTPSQYTIPTQINIDNVKKIECGGSYTMLLKNDGTLWACGDNDYSKLGLGNQDTTFKFTQVNVTGVKEVSCGNNHTFILKEDGTVWSCGSMQNGQTGHGISQGGYKLNFTQVDINNVKEIFCTSDSTFIIKNDGTLWACGNNGYGQLGLGNITSVGTFTQVDIDNVKQVVGRTHTVIVKNDGTLWVSGYNNYGELGLGDNTNRKNFTQVDIDNVKLAKTSDSYCTLILKNDGTVWGCGKNYAGELGLGTETKIKSFTKTFKQITMNYSFE